MPEQSRQLAAIMFTDIVGYPKLMGEDGDRAIRLLKKNRLIQKPLVEKHEGKWLKGTGDGIITSFKTVTTAVCGAGAIQKVYVNEPEHSNNLKMKK